MYAKQCESCYVEMKWENPFVKIIQFYLLSWNSSEIFPNRSYRASQISHNIYSAFQIPGLSEHSIKPKPILMMLDDLMANGERHRQTVAEWIFDFYINLLSSQMSVVVVGPENGMIIFFPNWDFYWSKDFDTSLWLKRFSCLMEAIREAWRKGFVAHFRGLLSLEFLLIDRLRLATGTADLWFIYVHFESCAMRPKAETTLTQQPARSKWFSLSNLILVALFVLM